MSLYKLSAQLIARGFNPKPIPVSSGSTGHFLAAVAGIGLGCLVSLCVYEAGWNDMHFDNIN